MIDANGIGKRTEVNKGDSRNSAAVAGRTPCAANARITANGKTIIAGNRIVDMLMVFPLLSKRMAPVDRQREMMDNSLGKLTSKRFSLAAGCVNGCYVYQT